MTCGVTPDDVGGPRAGDDDVRFGAGARAGNGNLDLLLWRLVRRRVRLRLASADGAGGCGGAASGRAPRARPARS